MVKYAIIINILILMSECSNIIASAKLLFPKLYITETKHDDVAFEPEKDDGHVEYKRTIADCSDKKAEKYATQMKWRISENTRQQYATYFIGVDDDGTIVGLADKEILDCIKKFVSISKTIDASITGIEIIYVKKLSIIRITVKIKKFRNNYLVEFEN